MIRTWRAGGMDLGAKESQGSPANPPEAGRWQGRIPLQVSEGALAPFLTSLFRYYFYHLDVLEIQNFFKF